MALLDFNRIREQARGFGNLSMLRQIGLMAGLAISVAIGFSLVLWAKEPEFRILYSNLSEQNFTDVLASLDQSGVKYRINEKGRSVLVAADDVYDARISLASKGLPHETDEGYEILDKSTGFGISSFMENARYQRALEGELARTISSINSVKNARVHLAIPKKSVFLRDKKQATASVTVDLYSGRKLEEQQVAAITHMVAASVNDIDPSSVTVIDQNGRLLTGSSPDSGIGLTTNQFDYRKKVEDYYTRRVEQILTPVLGVGAIKAQVSADIDFSITEQTRETFNPDLPAVRSEQTTEQASYDEVNGGVPGALSNQIPEEAIVSDGGGDSRTKNTTKSAVRNYELDKTVSHTKYSSGNIKRLSVAVVTDYIDATDPQTGEARRVPLNDDLIARITTLVKDAVGYDPVRGDSINIINAEFSRIEEVEETASLVENPVFWQAGKIVASVLVMVVLLFGVLRPVLKELARAKGSARPAKSGSAPQDEGVADEVDEALNRRRIDSQYEVQLNAAKGLAEQDPKRVAQVVSNWVSEDAQ